MIDTKGDVAAAISRIEDATNDKVDAIVINVDPAAQPGYRTVVVATGTQGLIGNFLVTPPPPPPTPVPPRDTPPAR